MAKLCSFYSFPGRRNLKTHFHFPSQRYTLDSGTLCSDKQPPFLHLNRCPSPARRKALRSEIFLPSCITMMIISNKQTVFRFIVSPLETGTASMLNCSVSLRTTTASLHQISLDLRLSCKLGFLIHFNLFLKILRKK